MAGDWKWKKFFRKRIRAVGLVATLLLVFGYHLFYLYVPPTMDSVSLYENLEPESVDTEQSCQLPFLHPFEPEVMSYFKSPTPISCRVKTPMLTFIDIEGYLRYNASAFREAGYTLDSLSCIYQEIWRGSEDSKVVFGEEKPMTGMEKPESDFTFVACSRSRWLPNIYSMYHAYVQRNPSVRPFRDDLEVGVAVVGIDSLSRLNFMRQLPKSFMALTRTMGAVVFKGFNKVGLNTLPNIVPILTGGPPGNTTSSATFDDWPFIWKPLRADDIATFYGEDLSFISTFSWWGAGFKKDPTHHYFNRYWRAVDPSALNAFSSPMCLGPVPKHKIYLGYLQSFLRAYRDSPLFMFSLENEPCHDYMNTVGVMDKDLEEFLLKSHAEGLFNRTILFVLADHGHRMDAFRKTPQGKLEDFMPMVSVVIPPWLAAKYPHLMDNLHSNSKKLASSYDLYSTFTDVFLEKIFQNKTASVNLKFSAPKFGQSLFQIIPLKRTCADAGIPEMYCVCKEDSQALTSDHPLVNQSVQILLRYMNDEVLNGQSDLWKSAVEDFTKANHSKNPTLTSVEAVSTSGLDQCAKLHLASVDQAEKVQKPDGRQIVHLKYKTSPNDGLYEGRVEWILSGRGRVHEDITRVNRYGKQADCLSRELLIMVPFVRSCCYCT